MSILNKPEGKILSVTERGFGLWVGQSQSTQTPEVKLGFFSSAVVIVPTGRDTNGVVQSPNFANTFDVGNHGALNLDIKENIASGNYQTLAAGLTNSAVTTQPITPK